MQKLSAKKACLNDAIAVNLRKALALADDSAMRDRLLGQVDKLVETGAIDMLGL